MRYLLSIGIIAMFCFFGNPNLVAQHVVQVERSQHFKETIPVNDVQVDNNNRIWVGTAEGLHVFGYYEGIKNIQEEFGVNAMAMDNNGLVWAGLENGDIISGDMKNRFNISSKGNDIQITGMTVQNTQLWIATKAKGVYVWDIENMKKTDHYTSTNSKISSNTINFIQADNYGAIWAGTNKGVCRISGKNWKTYEKSDNVTAVSIYKNDIWFIGEQKLWKVDTENRWARIKLDHRLTDGAVKDMAFDNEGRLYMASNIFTRYDIIADTLAVYDKEFGFVSDQSLVVTSDQKNNMWVGTLQNGLFRFRLYFKEPEPEEVEFSAICFSEKILDCAENKDGALGVRATGGRAPYYFKWSCEGCRGPVVQGLSAGTYTVTVSDSNKKSKVLITSVMGPKPLTLEIVKKTDTSKGGTKDASIEVLATGGNEGYVYKWENKTKGAERKRLGIGDYEVTVTDAKGCTTRMDVAITGPKIIPELEISQLETGQTITMEQLYFTADSLNYKEQSLPVLKEVYTFLKANKNVTVEIGGHTNSLPAKEYCIWLSTGRARTVAEYFYDKGIPKSQVSFKGYGKDKPIASNGSKAGRAKNQRVEIKVLDIR